MKNRFIKFITICFLFWWAIVFPQFNFLPEKNDEQSELEIHFWICDMLGW